MKLPEDFLESLSGVKGFDRDSFCRVHDSGDQVVSVRWNPAKFNPDFLKEFPGSEKVPWSSYGYYLPQRPSFILDPLWHAGAYYVQEPSSMFLEHVLKGSCDLSEPLNVLDLCAAPGGKSTLLQSIISKDSLLVSNEVIRSRVGMLDENLTKWGGANVIITQNDPDELGRMEAFFDVIVADVPCSGSGLFRKDTSAISEWSIDQVDHCAARQKRILSGISGALAPGGLLIYSTCSFSPEEDEDMADFIEEELELRSVSVSLDANWNIQETLSAKKSAAGYRFFPDKLKGEGFYMAAFRKEGQLLTRLFYPSRDNRRLTTANMNLAAPYCAESDFLFSINDTGQVRYRTPAVQNGILQLQPYAYIRKAGVRVGEIIRDKFNPDPEWALSGMVGSVIPSVVAEKEKALDYLRLMTPDWVGLDPGWYLVVYKGLGLGWIKVMKGRINNYYPTSWRILNK